MDMRMHPLERLINWGLALGPVGTLAAWAIFASADTYRPYMAAGWLLLACPWIARLLHGRARPACTLLDGAFAVFLATVALGAIVAYDGALAAREAGLIAVSVAAFYALLHWCTAARRLELAALAISASAAAFALYFVTQRDWSSVPGKFAPVAGIGRAINALVPNFDVHAPHPNIVAAVLLVGLIVALGQARARPAAAGLAALCAFGLLMTVGRGSWLMLAITALLWLAGRAARAWRPAAGRWVLASLLGAAFTGGALVVLTALPPLAAMAEAVLGRGDQGILRLPVWASSLSLARDYVFTGAGLGVFPMVYAAYGRISADVFVGHAHDLYLHVSIEQGLLAGLALVSLLAATAWHAFHHGAPAHPAGRAGLWAACALALLWLVDAPLYGDRAAPFLFAPLGLAWAAWGLQAGGEQRRPLPAPRVLIPFLPVVYFVMVIVVAGNPLAALYANAGALLQARLELSAHKRMAEARTWADCDALRAQMKWPFQVYLSCLAQPAPRQMDAVRAALDESDAVAWLERARSVSPGNATAAERLGALALARGEWARALDDLEPAYAAGSRARATRLLLAEALAAGGQGARAAQVAAGLDGAEQYLYDRAASH